MESIFRFLAKFLREKKRTSERLFVAVFARITHDNQMASYLAGAKVFIHESDLIYTWEKRIDSL